jgi:Platelet-activating factor acetylhydrolase, isoform II
MNALHSITCGLLGLILLTPTAAVAQSRLPKPTGEYGIGRCLLDWIDSTRVETQSGTRDAKRELLVYLFYPIDPQLRGVRADYFPRLKEVEVFEERFGKNFFRETYGDSYKTIATLKSHAIENAPVVAGKRPFPVLIFSHGMGIPVLYYTAMIENLVSHGYVVAAVEHTFDGGTVVFPDGRVVSQSGWDEDAKRTKEERAAFHAARYQVGAQDNSFVLSQLEKINTSGLPGVPGSLRGRLDTKKVGALGHSLGGMISMISVREDKRFRIGLNLDGGLDAGQTYGAIHQPVFAMYGDARKPQQPGESREAFEKRTTSRNRFVDRLKAPYQEASKGSYFLLVDSPRFSHLSYYDFPNAQAAEPAWRATPEQWERNQRIILDSTRAILDAFLYPARSQQIGEITKQFPEVILELIGKGKE